MEQMVSLASTLPLVFFFFIGARLVRVNSSDRKQDKLHFLIARAPETAARSRALI